MVNRTSIDIGGTQAVVTRLRELGLSFEQATATMKAAAAQYHGCWGNDEFGEAFAKAYEENSNKTLAYLGTLADNLGLAAGAVTKAVDALVKTDENNAART